MGHIRRDLAGYAHLIQSFVDRVISAAEFQQKYLTMVKTDQSEHGSPAFEVVNELFFYVDEYYDDPELSPEQRRHNREELANHAKNALTALEKIPPAN